MVRRLSLGLVLAAVAIAACSATTGSSSVRILGGTAIDVRSAPWAVAIQVGSSPGEDRCSGSIIDPTHILTVAHCAYHNGKLANPSDFAVKAGVSNYASPAKGDVEQDRSVSAVRVHPGFVNTELDVPDDVSVLTLSTPLDLGGPTARAIALPAPNAPLPVGATILIAGFGRIVEKGLDAGPLKSMTATVNPQGVCGDVTEAPFYKNNNGVFMCVDAPVAAACGGDSGDAMATTGSTPVVIGVLEDSIPGCAPKSVTAGSYVPAPEILSFIRGDDQPPTAPRLTGETAVKLQWKGSLVVGATLRCTAAGLPEATRLTYSFLSPSTGHVLQAGSRASYKVGAAAVGSTIACEAAVKGAGGTTLVESEPTSVVQSQPRVAIEHLAPVTVKRGQDVSLHVVLRSLPGFSGRFRACAALPASVGGEICRGTSGAIGSSGTLRFTLVLRIKPTAPPGTSRVAITGAAGRSTARSTALVRITT